MFASVKLIIVLLVVFSAFLMCLADPPNLELGKCNVIDCENSCESGQGMCVGGICICT